MDDQLTFRSIAKQRTGGIMARLLSTPGIQVCSQYNRY
jgi:hypothetical protein